MRARMPALRASCLVLAFTLAACGGSSGSSGGHAAPTAAASSGTGDAGNEPDASAEVSAATDAGGDTSTGAQGDSGTTTGDDAAADDAAADGTPDAGAGSDAGTDGEAGTGGDTGAALPSDGGIVSSDPFDPASCPGTPLTVAQAAQLFQSGASQAIVGSYAIEMRQRSCTALTGCGAWGTPTMTIAATLGDGIDRGLSGQIQLTVQGTSILLALQDSTEELPSFMGTQCSAIDGSTETCGAYEYNLGDQWGGSGGDFPTLEPLIDQNGANVMLSGVLTGQCLRLSYAALDSNGNDVQEYAVLAPVSAGAPPPVNPCPGGGTQMACGSQASQGTTCCGAGLTTCPSSGCDCWAACN